MSKGKITEEEIRQQWPLHWLVWNNSHKHLDRLLAEKQNDIEQLDPRGRTPLHLAVALGRVECTIVLLKHGANALANNRHHWSVLNEAVCTGNPELIGLVLQYRDQQQKALNIRNIPLMLEKLQSTPDYYIEMKWEFSSWIPLVSRMCPSDTCKIWKRGTTVRVDTSLVGFQNMRWQRGHQTLIFEATSKGHRICDINHGDKTYWDKEFKIAQQTPDPVQMIMSHEMGVLHRLSSPVVSTHIDTDAISFQRQRSGFWGFRSDKVEEINGYSAKVFAATGLNIKTDTRVEHLPEAEKKKQKSISPLQDFLGAAQNQASNVPAIEPPSDSAHSMVSQSVGPKLSIEQYFTEPNNKEEPDGIGRPPEVTTKTQKLKATVCLAEDFPLDLQEQIMPIIDLMAMNTPHFAKVKDFINLQMPAGFPVRFEIPLFHVMSAKVTFGNVNGRSEPVPHVSLHTEQRRIEPAPTFTPTGPVSLTTTEGGEIKHRHGQASAAGSSVDPESECTPVDTAAGVVSPGVQTHDVCIISEDCFSVPSTYRRLNTSTYSVADEEEELLQLAIRQSLMEQGGGANEEQLSLKEALGDHALMGRQMPVQSRQMSSGRGLSAEDEELEMALALSQQMAEEEKRKKQREEEDARDEDLQRVLRLSLEDK